MSAVIGVFPTVEFPLTGSVPPSFEGAVKKLHVALITSSSPGTQRIRIIYNLKMAAPEQCLVYLNDTLWPKARRFTYVSEAMILPAIYSIGIITNTMSLIVLGGVPMNKVFRVCLISLTISDLLTTLVGLAQIVVEVVFYCGQVPEGHFLMPVIANNVLYTTFLMLLSNSASLVVFIAFIRNMMFLKPMKARAFFTPKITKRACGAISLTTFIICLPNCLQEFWLLCYKEKTDDIPEFCVYIYRQIPNLKTVANGYLFFTVTVYAPILLLAYVANFICMRITLHRSAKNIKEVAQLSDLVQQRHSTVNRITKLLSLILVCDVICTLPSIAQSVGLVFDPEDGVLGKKSLFFELIDPISEIFIALRPTYNFWLYVFQTPEFRRRLCLMAKMSAARCRCSRRPPDQHSSTDNQQIYNISASSSSLKVVT